MNEEYATTTEPKELSIWGYFVRSLTKKYATFTGRARRKEYWGTILFFGIILGIFGGLGGGSVAQDFAAQPEISEYLMQNPSDTAYVYSLLGGNIFYWVYMIVGLVLLVPTLAMLCRRYHDINLSSTVFWVINWILVVNMIVGILMLISPDLVAGIVSIVGTLAALVNLVNLVIGFIPGKKGPNAYGPDPKPEEIPTWDQTVQ